MHKDYGIPNGKFSLFFLQPNLRPRSPDYEGILIVVSEWRAGRDANIPITTNWLYKTNKRPAWAGLIRGGPDQGQSEACLIRTQPIRGGPEHGQWEARLNMANQRRAWPSLSSCTSSDPEASSTTEPKSADAAFSPMLSLTLSQTWVDQRTCGWSDPSVLARHGDRAECHNITQITVIITVWPCHHSASTRAEVDTAPN